MILVMELVKTITEEKNIPFETIIVDTTQISEFKNSRFEIIKIDVEGAS